MGYRFEGVFVERPALSAEDLEKLFQGFAREIEQLFVGSVVSFKEERDQISIKPYVLEKSKQLPNSKMAYIHYSTWGGPVEYVFGFACQNGVLIEGSEQGKEDDLQNEVLILLLKIMGAEPSNGYFAPFERGFFPNT